MIDEGLGKLVGGAAAVLIAGGSIALATWQDRFERDLLATGDCRAVMEVLCTPPRRAHSSCSGDTGSQTCTSWYSSPDPYLRTLWRCPDSKIDGGSVDFWRRSAERLAP